MTPLAVAATALEARQGFGALQCAAPQLPTLPSHSWMCEKIPGHWGEGSQVHSFTCLLQSLTEIHHLGCNKFWHTPLLKFTPFPFSLHWYPLSPPSLRLTVCWFCCFLDLIPVAADLQWPQFASWGFVRKFQHCGSTDRICPHHSL